MIVCVVAINVLVRDNGFAAIAIVLLNRRHLMGLDAILVED